MLRKFMLTGLLFLSLPAAATDFSLMFDEDRLMTSIRQDAPVRFEQLEKLRTRDRSEYYKQLYRTAQVIYNDGNDPRIKNDMMTIWDLTGLLDDLAIDFHSAMPTEKASIRREMAEVASEVEMLNMEVTELRIAAAQKNVVRMQANMKRWRAVESRRVESQVKRSLQGK